MGRAGRVRVGCASHQRNNSHRPVPPGHARAPAPADPAASASILGAAPNAAWPSAPVRVLATARRPPVDPAAPASIPEVAGPAVPRRRGVPRTRGSAHPTMPTADPTASASAQAPPPGVPRSSGRLREFRSASGGFHSADSMGTTVRVAPNRGPVICHEPLIDESRYSSLVWALTNAGQQCRILRKTGGHRAKGTFGTSFPLGPPPLSVLLYVHQRSAYTD
jgi:hypothetical protein